MIFHSFGFLFVFLPAALAAWWAAAAGKKAWSLPVLTAASLLFYSLWHWPHLGVLCASIAFNYAAGKRIHAGAGPWLLRCAVGANLALLAGFKYLPSLGYDILLPLGISFFTFTQIAFLLDARQGDISPLRPVHYALFVSFFPHCIAGPILHHKEMMDQFAAPDVTRPRKDHIASGLAYLTIGLAKKVMLADTLAPWANAAFSADGPAGMAGAWAGVLTYALQLYFDFSGYCDMANGLALLFNIRFPRNFDAPYQAASMIEFWQRWHITLSRFLRDYVLFQLPGNRRRGRMMANLFLTFLLGGIWHGAGWSFALWGAMHGACLVVNHAWRMRRRNLPEPLARGLTLVAVLVAWVPFRADDLAVTGRYFAAMAGLGGGAEGAGAALPGGPWQAAALAAGWGAVLFAPTAERYLERRTMKGWHAAILSAMFFLCLLLLRETFLNIRHSEFIYFRF